MPGESLRLYKQVTALRWEIRKRSRRLDEMRASVIAEEQRLATLREQESEATHRLLMLAPDLLATVPRFVR